MDTEVLAVLEDIKGQLDRIEALVKREEKVIEIGKQGSFADVEEAK